MREHAAAQQRYSPCWFLGDRPSDSPTGYINELAISRGCFIVSTTVPAVANTDS